MTAARDTARPFRVIGTRVAKLDAFEKVTGTVRYLPDLELPGMVWGKILRTPVPHARIRRIDVDNPVGIPVVRKWSEEAKSWNSRCLKQLPVTADTIGVGAIAPATHTS